MVNAAWDVQLWDEEDDHAYGARRTHVADEVTSDQCTFRRQVDAPVGKVSVLFSSFRVLLGGL